MGAEAVTGVLGRAYPRGWAGEPHGRWVMSFRGCYCPVVRCREWSEAQKDGDDQAGAGDPA